MVVDIIGFVSVMDFIIVDYFGMFCVIIDGNGSVVW